MSSSPSASAGFLNPTRSAAAASNRRPLAHRLVVAPLAAAIVVPTAIEGGFTDTSRSIFVGLALCSLAVVYALDDRPFAAFARSLPVVSLIGLAALAMLSGAWTIGDAGEAQHAGLVTAAIAGVALVSAWMVRENGVAWIAGLIAAVAMVEAAIGLTALVLEREPFAQVIGAAWRPGGTFEYPPALAVLQVSALPIFAWMAVRGSAALRIAGLAGAVLALAVLAAAESRLALGLCMLLVVVAAVAGRRSRAQQPKDQRRTRVLAGVAAVGLLIAVTAVVLRGGGEGAEPVSGADHGRLTEWGFAIDAIVERPLAGAGADTYAQAASEAGGGETLFAHNLALEMWVELGLAGFALVIALFISIGALVWRLRSDLRAWLLAPAVLAFPLANLVDWTWHLAGAAALWAAALGALLALDADVRRPGGSLG